MEMRPASSEFAHGCSYLDQNINTSVKAVKDEGHGLVYLPPNTQYNDNVKQHLPEN